MFRVAKKLILVVAAVGALSIAGVAVARSVDDDHGAKAVVELTGTFAATSASGQTTQSCTTSNGQTIATTKARYTGSATGAADLTGPITINARKVINTGTNVGFVDGSFKITTAAGVTKAEFEAVYDGGTIVGLAEGSTATHGKLVANLSAGLNGGFTNGKLGGGTAGGSAIELGPASCASSSTSNNKSEAEGSISAVSSTSIAVAGLTCAVPSNLTSTVANYKVGDKVEIKCSVSGSTQTLVKIEREDD